MRSKVTPWPHTEATALTKKSPRKTMPHSIYHAAVRQPILAAAAFQAARPAKKAGQRAKLPAPLGRGFLPHASRPLQEPKQLTTMLPHKLAKLLGSNLLRMKPEVRLHSPAKI